MSASVFKNWHLLGVKTIPRHTHQTGSWYMYLLGVLLKYVKRPRPFHRGVPGIKTSGLYTSVG